MPDLNPDVGYCSASLQLILLLVNLQRSCRFDLNGELQL